jgi:hypothetical protein
VYEQENKKTINEWMRLVDRKTYVHGYIDMLNLDLRKRISKIKIPVIILLPNPDLTTVQNTYKAQYSKIDQQLRSFCYVRSTGMA